MNVATMKVKEETAFKAAPLRNLALLEGLMNRTMERQPHLPGIVTFSGPSGFGKSTAAAYVAAKKQAHYVEIRSMWTKKPFLEMTLRQMGIIPQKMVNDMINQIAEELATSQRPLILDEFDNAVKQHLVEIVRDIYEMSGASIVLIGEEQLPQKLQKWERFHGRILAWGQADAANIDDARALNKHYEPDVTVEDDLLKMVVSSAHGSIRRIVTNLNNMAQYARAEGNETLSATDWGGRAIIGSRAPAARNFNAV
ncbi:MAG: DNA transposition protein [Micavibrio aeruginosavorus]|uniref:DNA transposition protein n=1 Tax=Micavibrio aeruginosavorus TaxID=349221 RepID=A0A2W5MYJ0_9BACT|nr:MAG: DNA transposition protein [Micavibrio aeruginosavorus]